MWCVVSVCLSRVTLLFWDAFEILFEGLCMYTMIFCWSSDEVVFEIIIISNVISIIKF